VEKSHEKEMLEVADIMPPKGKLNFLGGFLVLDFDKGARLAELSSNTRFLLDNITKCMLS